MELPVPDRGERRRAGADGRQRVLLKHSAQTPLCAERFAEAFDAAGLPAGVFQSLHLNHADTDDRDRSDRASTSSPSPARCRRPTRCSAPPPDASSAPAWNSAARIPAYVRPDADLEHAVENLVDGAFFNSGQSCCGIERIYVHAAVYDDFVDGVRRADRGRTGSAIRCDPDTTLGPMVRDRRRRLRARADRRGASRRAPAR